MYQLPIFLTAQQRIFKCRSISSKQLVALLLTTILLTQCTVTAEASIRLCGNKLTSALQTICKNKICGGITKRAINPYYLEELFERNMNPFEYYDNRVRRSQIASQCCAKRCTLNFMKSFCCAEVDDTVNLEKIE
ncbi:unnamed protein product [Bursaphelenchus okinawaensis]|uniref:Insulin-like domain-containing protein n=1 Tax=Bursaphelenchus okinawaensis TaxID=465554 RepID=A0A811KY61_9BILA|nr:unnamed protein product [Bursaphelenchus okinawaensis]CAG9114432.1 unnamed protein product [Bursaphelenchus okinawaensis]